MKKMILLYIAVSVLLIGSASAEEKVLTMSTTTSTQSSGLLDILLPAFKKDTGIEVKVIAKGTGAAIRDGMDGNVDVIFVHAKAREEKFVEEGYGTKRYAVMHNDFVVIGPPADPAALKGMENISEALEKIATANALFISRGDDSGTHTKEQSLWKLTDLQLIEKTQILVKNGQKKEISFIVPAEADKWYISVGQGMGKTLTFADEKQAYTLTDRGTFIKYKYGKTPPIDLVVIVEGQEALANPYGVIPVNPEKHPHVKFDEAQKFANWLISPKGQKLINEYRLVGKQLFYPDAISSEELQ
ncbi:substrate-binding domain-containing protein [Desulfopila inferna]|uniref:substrate-binding domain-containing protein n=1 Tax=Desulfopila inferna TaxID=468528 RepID=UPI0019630F75|nr:substrate-binding domain-containing protein [Desulfopila inferna]MBM9604896.1 extracellular solute-binding protein [Desulfopila inferna]